MASKETCIKCPKRYQVGQLLVPRGFVKCFLRVTQAVGLYCSYTAAPASKGNFQKMFYKTFGTWAAPPGTLCLSEIGIGTLLFTVPCILTIAVKNRIHCWGMAYVSQ